MYEASFFKRGEEFYAYIPSTPVYDGSEDKPREDLVYAFLDMYRSEELPFPHYKSLP